MCHRLKRVCSGPNCSTADTQVKLKSVFNQESGRISGIRQDIKNQAGQAGQRQTIRNQAGQSGQRQATLMTVFSLECRKVNNNLAGNEWQAGFFIHNQ